MRLLRAEFERAVREAVDSIPPQFRRYLDGVVIDVEDRPDRQTLEELEVDDADDLLGAYLGTPLTDRHSDDVPPLPDRIVIYQRSVEDACATRAELVREIAITVLHEIGHHFGLDEDALDELGFG